MAQSYHTKISEWWTYRAWTGQWNLEPFEQVSQIQAQLLRPTFEMLSGGPTQTHVGTGGGGSSSDMPWGEKKKDGNMTTSRRKRWHLVANQ